MPTETAQKRKPRVHYRLLDQAVLAKIPSTAVNSADEVVPIAFQALAPFWSTGSEPHIYPSDNFYMCPSLDLAKEIIDLSVKNRKTYIDEAFDCDDFTILLKADFSLCSYQYGKRKGGYAFGIVWFDQIKPHAMNWMVNADGEVRFVEPQSGEIIETKDIVAWGHYGITLAAL